MRSPKIEIKLSTLFCYACFLVGAVLVLYTMAALPAMIDESVAVSQKNRIQRDVKDAYNKILGN